MGTVRGFITIDSKQAATQLHSRTKERQTHITETLDIFVKSKHHREAEYDSNLPNLEFTNEI